MRFNLFQKSRIHASNDDYDNRRSEPRRTVDNCIGMIDGTTFPVENWSRGGVMFRGDSRLYSIGDTVEMTLKFRLSDRIVDVPTRGRIVRKSGFALAMQFEGLDPQNRRQFQNVIDDWSARQFVSSQQ